MKTSKGALKELWLIQRLLSILLWPVVKSDGTWKLVWHNSSIHIRIVVISDGVWKAGSATFFHRQEAYLYPDGMKNLVPAHFSISQKLSPNLMDWNKASFPRLLHRGRAFHSLAGQTGQVDSIDQEILLAWMERKAWRESRRAVVSILAEIILLSMVWIAKSGREIFHQPRNLLILDVGDSKKCPNGVHRGRNFLNIDGATTAQQPQLSNHGLGPRLSNHISASNIYISASNTYISANNPSPNTPK